LLGVWLSQWAKSGYDDSYSDDDFDSHECHRNRVDDNDRTDLRDSHFDLDRDK
jgi:hypothetical protein